MIESRRGLSLVEVVVALGLLTVGALAVAQSIVLGARLSRESAERSHARVAAEARLSELRTLLHRSSWTDPSLNQGDAQITHDAQFNLVLAEHGSTRQIDLLDDVNGGQIRIPATMTTYIYATSEPEIALPVATGASGGLGLVSVDLDANGSSSDTSVPLSSLMMVGVKIEVTWRPAGWRVGQDEEVFRLVALLY